MNITCLTCVSLMVAAVIAEPGQSQAPSGKVPVITAAGEKVKAHAKELAAVAISADGRWLASGSYDKTIKLWSLPSGDLARTLTGHKEVVGRLAFSPDGRLLASSSDDKTIAVWTVDDGKQAASLGNRGQWVRDIQFSPDGRLLASEAPSELHTWSMPDGKLVATVPSGSMRLERAAFTPDGTMVAFPTKTAIEFLSLPDLQSRPSLTCGEREEVKRIAVSADGTKLVAACFGGVRVWSLATRELLTTIPGDASRVNVLAVNPDATIAATGDAPGVVRIWNLTDGRVGAPLTGHTNAVISLALSRDGRMAASGSMDATVRLWSTAENTAVAVLEGHRGSIDHLYLTPDGTTLISGQESSFDITGVSGNSMTMRKIKADALIALWDVSPAKFRRFLGR